MASVFYVIKILTFPHMSKTSFEFYTEMNRFTLLVLLLVVDDVLYKRLLILHWDE